LSCFERGKKLETAMIKTSMTWNTDKRISEHFSNLKENQKFLQAVGKIRKAADIPAGGYTLDKLRLGEVGFMGKDGLPSKKRAIIEKGVETIMGKFELGPHLAEIITGYIVKGENYSKGMIDYIENTVGCSLSEQGDHYVLYIYPEATKNQVFEFLKKHWDEIDNWFKQQYPKRHKFKLKTKPKRERDSQIVLLYDWGVLTFAGEYRRENAKVFLAERGIKIENAMDISDGFKKLGYNLPTNEAIRKVIERHNKLRKS